MAEVKESALLGMMADLHRGRNDQFYLSNETRRGPTFTPSAATAKEAKNVAPEKKAALQAGWSTFVDDEESEQMKGLSDAEARPWAQSIALQVMKSIPAPAAARKTQTSKKQKQKLENQPPSSSKPTQPLYQVPQVARWSTSKQTGVQATASARQPLSNITQKPQMKPMVFPPPSKKPPAAATPKRPAKADASLKDCKIYMIPPSYKSAVGSTDTYAQGYFQLALQGQPPFICEFDIVFPPKTFGMLILKAAGKPTRSYSFPHLTVRTDPGSSVLIKTSDPLYFQIQMCDQAMTDRLRGMLAGLHGIKTASGPVNTVSIRTLPVQGKETPAQESNDGARPETQGPVVESSQASGSDIQSSMTTREEADLLSDVTAQFASVQIDDMMSGQCTPTTDSLLIDFESEPDSNQIAEQILELLGLVLPSISQKGITVNEHVLQGVQDTVIAEWMERNQEIRSSVDAEDWEDIMDVVRATIKLKVKAARKKNRELNSATPGKRSVLNELEAEFATVEREFKLPNRRQTYSQEQLEDLIPAKGHPDHGSSSKWEALRLGAGIPVSKAQVPPPMPTTIHFTPPTPPAISIEQPRELKKEPSHSVSSDGPQPAKGLVSLMPAARIPVPTEADAPQSPQVGLHQKEQKSQGLSTSMWAVRTPDPAQAAAVFAENASAVGINVGGKEESMTSTATSVSGTLAGGLKGSRWAE